MNHGRRAAEPRPVRRHAVTILAGAALLAVACSPGSGDPTISAGDALYDEHCRMCHGETALGDGPMAASLPVQPASLIEHLGHHTMAELTRLVISGIPPAMPPAAVSEEEVGLIVDHLWTLVPADQVAALRGMQRQIEEAGQRASASAERLEFAFTGTIVRIDDATRIVAVQNEDIPGWMMSMTMNYYLQPPEVLETLVPGDRITATVYSGDVQNLYQVEALPE
ncbi:MAG: copper-binding protein [Gemmatimonadota bacterium]|nr:copper-binding protein [Gemmatimonadota bacterium]